MADGIEIIEDGSVTSPQGYKAGGVYAGLKSAGEGVLDLGILVSERPAAVAGTFSTNKILSPSVTVSKRRIESGVSRGVVANSGCANCSVGEQGILDAEEMTRLAAAHVGVSADELCVASTGMIGVELPMGIIRDAMEKVELTEDGGEAFARSIMTTDSRPKHIAARFSANGTDLYYRRSGQGCGHDSPGHGYDAVVHYLRR